jgi:hypothetical protein
VIYVDMYPGMWKEMKKPRIATNAMPTSILLATTNARKVSAPTNFYNLVTAFLPHQFLQSTQSLMAQSLMPASITKR